MLIDLLRDHLGNRVRFVSLIDIAGNADRLTFTIVGEEMLFLTAFVICDQGIGGTENSFGASVVFARAEQL